MKENLIEDNKKMDKHRKVVKSNLIIDAIYKLKLAEQRMILYLISEIESRDRSNIDEVFAIQVEEFERVFNVKGKRSQEALDDIINDLYDRSVLIPDTDHPSSNRGYLKTRWLQSIKYDAVERIFYLRIAADIKPYLCELKKQFTQYDLKHVAKFTSIYAIKLYEVVIKWTKIGEKSKKIEVSWLRTYFYLEDKYSIITDFRRRVLDVAIKQINQYSDIDITYDVVKDWKTITHFEFKFQLKERANNKEKIIQTEEIRLPNQLIYDWTKIYEEITEKKLLNWFRHINYHVALHALQEYGYQHSQMQAYIIEYIEKEQLQHIYLLKKS